MRKILALLLAALLVLLSAGCSPDAESSSPPATQAPTTQAPSTQMPVTEPPTTQAPSTQAPTEPVTEPVTQVPPEPSLMDERIPAGSGENLFYLARQPESFGDLLMPQLYAFGEDLLICTEHYSNRGSRLELQLLSLMDGSLLGSAEVEVSGMYSLFFREGAMALVDGPGGCIRVYDGRLQLQQELAIDPCYDELVLSSDWRSLYILDYLEGVWVTDLATGSGSALLESCTHVNVAGCSERWLLFSYTDLDSQQTENVCLDLADGSLEPLPVPLVLGESLRLEEGWLLEDSRGELIYSLSDQDSRVLLQQEQRLEPTEQGLLATGRDSESLSFYWPDGSHRSSCLLEEGCRYLGGQSPVWSEYWQGWFFLCYDSQWMPRLCFWDALAPSQGQDLALQPQEPAQAGVDQDLLDRARELEQRYGVQIRLGGQCPLEYSSYTTSHVTGREDVSRALDMLERVFSAYPEGFLRQLCYGDVDYLRFDLVGGLEVKSGSGIASNAAGFAQERGTEYLIALDIWQINAMTIFHELTHVMDRRMAFDAQLRPEALFSERRWMELQPEGFSYGMTYMGLPEQVLAFAHSGYFAEEYSMTYPTEDRATMMEAVMTNDIFVFQENPQLLPKLSYYVKCIRDCFDTGDWSQIPQWELFLEYVNEA